MSNSNTFQTFVEAILAEPHNETHRLVCADWLCNQGRTTEAEHFRQLPSTAALWSVNWGKDEFGLWSTLRLGKREQRLRWIDPGRYWMGSPEDETGRSEREGPRHEVVIPRGFWLFDTPCTTGLWHEVMKDNPSFFSSFNRPVERVSWQDCQQFIRKVNSEVCGISLRLPTEAEWEYAVSVHARQD